MKRITIFSLFILLSFNAVFAQIKLHDLQITYVANEGFLLHTFNRKVLINALFSDGNGIYPAPSSDLINTMLAGQAPFDNVSHYFLTDYHNYNCNPKLVKEYLTNNANVKFITHKPALVFIDGCEFGFVKLKNQFFEMTPEINRSVNQRIGDGTLRAVGIKHAPYMENDVDLEEYMFSSSYYVVLDGIRIFHSADISMESLKDFVIKNAGWKDAVDVAFLNCDLLKNGKQDLKYLVKNLNPKYIVVMHVPTAQYDEWVKKIEELKSDFPNIILFKESMEMQTLNFK